MKTAHATWSDSDGAALTSLLMRDVKQYGIVFLNLDGSLRGWSEGAYAITGFSADDVIGKSIELIFTPEDVARKLHVHELNNARLLGVVEDERWHIRKDGSRFWASGTTQLLSVDGEPLGFAKLFRDVTHLRLRMNALDNEARQMRKERSDRDIFLATTAHELRNPLQPMTVATKLLTHPSDPVRHEQAITILERQLGLIQRLVEDLIDMTRVGQGKMSIDYQSTQLQHLLQDAADSSRHAAEEKSISLLCAYPPVPIAVEVDPARMNQVVVNLLNNAIKFTPPGGRVTLLGNVDESHFIVKVQDTGIGIAPDLQPTIFEMFTQAEMHDTGRGQGLGIGLALVKQIVSLHRGTVEVRSEGAGKGSEFLIRVPLVKPVEAEPRSV